MEIGDFGLIFMVLAKKGNKQKGKKETG